MFEKIQSVFYTPKHQVIRIKKELFDYPELYHQWLEEFSAKNLEGFFESNLLFVHPCPHDESSYKELSFAGCFKSYKPYSWKNKKENIIDGMKYVYTNRNNRISNYYYNAHNIKSNKSFDVIISEAEDADIYGTAYVFDDIIMCSYYSSYVSVYNHDPHSFIYKGGSNNTLNKTELLICETLIEIKRILKLKIDVEFMVNGEKIIISEVRPISSIHIKNYEKVIGFPNTIERNLLNSTYEIEGKIVDMEQNKSRLYDMKNNIFLIDHNSRIFSTLDFLEWCSSNEMHEVSVIINHGNNRDFDHTQYIAFEDPRIINISNVYSRKKFIAGETLTIKSDGFFTNGII